LGCVLEMCDFCFCFCFSTPRVQRPLLLCFIYHADSFEHAVQSIPVSCLIHPLFSLVEQLIWHLGICLGDVFLIIKTIQKCDEIVCIEC